MATMDGEVMTKDKALDLALGALKEDRAWLESDAPIEIWEKNNEAITAIKQARALDKKAENARELGLDYEPLADFDDAQVQAVYNILCDADEGKPSEEHWEGWKARQIVAALTTPPAAQRQWVGLTNEEIAQIYLVNTDKPLKADWLFARAIERKLKEKNT